MLAAPVSRRTTRTRRSGFTLIEVMAVVTILVILAGLGTFAIVRTLSDAKTKECLLKMQKVESMCKNYYTQTGGQWPNALDELIQPSNGKPPLLEGGPDAISDPWGKPFNYTVGTDNFGSQRVILTTTDDSGNMIQWPQK